MYYCAIKPHGVSHMHVYSGPALGLGIHKPFYQFSCHENLCCFKINKSVNVPVTRYVKLRVAHAPGIPGTFFLPITRVNDPDMHRGTCLTHVPWCMSGSLTSDFFWKWRGKRSHHFRCMRNPQFYISGKRPMEKLGLITLSPGQCLHYPGAAAQ